MLMEEKSRLIANTADVFLENESETGAPTMTRKLGNTTFDVYVHFSKTSKETLTDKVMRLIRNDCLEV